MWRDQYEELLNSSGSFHEKEYLLEHFKSISSHVGMQVTMLEVLQIVKDLPNAKSSGFDGLNGESLKYAHSLLCLLLSIGFTCMFKHYYIPQCMINSVIIPLIKNKCRDQTDKNHYRPIALSSIILHDTHCIYPFTNHTMVEIRVILIIIFLIVIYLFFYCMHVFFITMFYCVYGQMSEIKNYHC